MMNTYFCPQCGRSLEASECVENNSFLRCPDCQKVRVIWRGRVLITVGLLIAFTGTLLPVPYVTTMGNVIGGGLCVTGFVRSLRQRWILNRQREDESDFPEEEFEDF